MILLGLQFNIAWENKPANFNTVRRLLAEARPPREALVVLPEMFATGFSMNAGLIAENAGGETSQFLASAAREYGISILAGAALRGADGRVRNEALWFDPQGRCTGSYAKIRPFTPALEHEHYAAGTQPSLFAWGEIHVAPFICYDLRFPELFRAAAAWKQPELYAVIANFPSKRIQHWTRLLQARAIENQAYVIGVNRIGADPACEYNGQSIIVDPQGEILADAGGARGCIRATLNLDDLRKYRAGLPFLKDQWTGGSS